MPHVCSFRVALLVALGTCACIQSEPPRTPTLPPSTDAGTVGTSEITIAVHDARGNEWPVDGAPRRPVFSLTSPSGFALDRDGIFLLPGALDPELASDLESFPLESRHSKRALRTTIERSSDRIELSPAAPLELGGTYVLAIGSWIEDAQGIPLLPEERPASLAVHVVDAHGGAIADAAWPPDGIGGVPVVLPLVAVHFDDSLDPERQQLRIEAGSQSIELRQSTVPCTQVGWSDGYCVALEPVRELQPSTMHRIIVNDDVLDHTGASVGPWSAQFQTGLGASSTFAWTPPTCSVDEKRVGDFCVLAGDGRVAVRVQASEAVRLWLTSSHGSVGTIANRGAATLSLSRLPSNRTFQGVVRAIDLGGRVHEQNVSLESGPELPALFITEVRANPRGPEPRQEYVEVLNSGEMPLDLEGFSIADSADGAGDVIASSVVLPPSTRALLVADAFDPEHEADDPVPSGVLLVRVGSSIATAGLLNTGEALYLRDREGHRVSAAPAMPPPRPGVCIVRVSEDGRTGAPDAFAYDAEDGCTPGREDRAPSP